MNADMIIDDYYSIGYWSIVEVNLGVICACMPSIRVLLSSIFSRPAGGADEHVAFQSTEQSPAVARLDRDLSDGIHRTKSYSYSIEYNPKPTRGRDGLRFVQLVDMTGAASNKSEIGIVERAEKKPCSGWRV
jgi:hypothetical protein